MNSGNKWPIECIISSLPALALSQSLLSKIVTSEGDRHPEISSKQFPLQNESQAPQLRTVVDSIGSVL